jgi:6-phosphogluconate dehydrogenase
VPDSGEGRWTAVEAIDRGVAALVLTLALQMRFASQNETGYGYCLLSTMRNASAATRLNTRVGKK